MNQADEQSVEAYVELGQQGHVEVLTPVLGGMLGDLSGKRVLDFGCGPGDFTVMLHRLGADHVTAIDQSIEMVRAAQQTATEHGVNDGRMSFEAGDDGSLPLRKPVDAVVCSLMLMTCASREKLERTVRGLVASLDERGGRLVIVVTHPCFRRCDYGNFHYEVPELFNYWDAARAYEVVMHPEGSEHRAVVTDYHWTLSDYVNAVLESGATLREVRELPAHVDRVGNPVGPPAYWVMLAER